MIKFARVLVPLTFNGTFHMDGTLISGEEADLAPFVDEGKATWCDPPPEPEEPPAP